MFAFSSSKCTLRRLSNGVIVTVFKRFLKYSVHLPRMAFSLLSKDTILVFHVSSSMRSFVVKIPNTLP